MSAAASNVVPIEKAAAPRPKPATQIIGELPVYQQLQRIGGALTPVQVSAIIRSADIGEMAGLMDLGNEARQKDCHLQGVLGTREGAVEGLEWALEPPEKPKRQEKKAAKLVEDSLRPILSTLLGHHTGARYYGYAVSEIDWTKSSQYLVPRAFRPIAPRRFRFVGNRLLWRDDGMGDGVDIVTAYPGKFVVSRPRTNGDVPCREGLIRPLMWAALFRNWALGDWVKLAEIAWKPWRIGRYKKEAFSSQDDVDNLIAVLDGMSSTGIAVLPDTVEVTVQFPAASGGSGGKTSHGELFATLAAEMSKCVLGQTETTESSKSSGYAQAKVHNDVRKDKIESDARYIEMDVLRDVIQWIVLLNFGPSVRPPKLVFLLEETADMGLFSSGIKALVDAGLRVPAVWAREELGIPEPEEGEEIVGDVGVEPEEATAVPAITPPDPAEEPAAA
jgi:phage gp29-like protein